MKPAGTRAQATGSDTEADVDASGAPVLLLEPVACARATQACERASLLNYVLKAMRLLCPAVALGSSHAALSQLYPILRKLLLPALAKRSSTGA